MKHVEISSSSDAVALAVALSGHLPSNELVVIPQGLLGSGVPITPLDPRPSLREVGRLLAGIKGIEHHLEGRQLMAVAFGSIESAAMVGAVMERLRPDEVTPVFAYTDGLARRWEGEGLFWPASGEPVDLAAHPFVVEALATGHLQLRTRGEIRASFAPAQLGAQRAAYAREALHAEQSTIVTMAPHKAAQRAYEQALSGYLDEGADRGITVSDEHAAMLAAAALDLQVRDLLLIHFTTENAPALAEVWRQVAAVLDGPNSGAAAILAAACHWASRHAVAAREALNAGLESAPEHSLGRLLERALDAGIHPSMWEHLRTAAAQAAAEQSTR
ncbi:DUF4192 family protein [Rhodococcus opacus]|uniref:DUF4192 family protein n=1 Tax=Rhodococcus opacus TaxID=37919 RepID=UPI00294930F2|nr:DUF4192 family protein [Rhodococcus opacus]MDV6246236.1 DUF4192 family protein [Rhodococcus opacus]